MNNVLKKAAGALAIPVIVAVVLNVLCALGGRAMLASKTSFDNFVVYTAIVMITTMALSINLNSGRFDFSLGAMAVLSAVIGAKLSYVLLAGGPGYVLLRIPPIITSLGVTLIYEGITYTITGGRYMMTEVQNADMAAFAGNWYWGLLIIVAVLAGIIVLFDHTRFGVDYRALKEGQRVSVNTGIREVPNALGCYAVCGALMGIVGFLNAARNTNINGGSLSFGSIGIMFTAFLPMFIGGYISRWCNEKIGYLLAALCMSMLNSTFAVYANQVNASMQSIINAVLLVLFLIYLNNEYRIASFFKGPRAQRKAAQG